MPRAGPARLGAAAARELARAVAARSWPAPAGAAEAERTRFARRRPDNLRRRAARAAFHKAGREAFPNRLPAAAGSLRLAGRRARAEPKAPEQARHWYPAGTGKWSS